MLITWEREVIGIKEKYAFIVGTTLNMQKIKTQSDCNLK